MTSNFSLVYGAVSKIPKGKVATYGQIAKLTGIKNPRVVGNILHKNPDPRNIPCHRVVNFQGKTARNYAFGGREIQLEKLRKEDVVVKGERVDLSQSLWFLEK
jgi:O-6-methylguanine DNA methyltransferase